MKIKKHIFKQTVEVELTEEEHAKLVETTDTVRDTAHIAGNAIKVVASLFVIKSAVEIVYLVSHMDK